MTGHEDAIAARNVRVRGTRCRIAVIGTDPGCDIVVRDDPYVSPRHARITEAVPNNPVNGARGVYELTDLASTNGTFVERGGVRLLARPWMTLVPGDIIVVGRTWLPWSTVNR